MAEFDSSGLCVGVVALQGAFVEHCKMLAKLNVKSREIRNIEDLKGINALILPGGESTAMAKVSAGNNIFAEISKLVENKMPVWGTCAGLILLANKVEGQKTGGQGLIGGLDIVASRNFFGAQVNSFEALLRPPPTSKRPKKRKRTVDGTVENLVEEESHTEKENLFNGVFIRAPAILKANDEVEILNSLIVNNNCTERKREVIVAVKQENILATAFHPELTSDCRWHQYFYEEIVLKKVRESF